MPNQIINVPTRSVRDLTPLSYIPLDKSVLKDVKIVIGNLPLGFSGEAITMGQLAESLPLNESAQAELNDLSQKINNLQLNKSEGVFAFTSMAAFEAEKENIPNNVYIKILSGTDLSNYIWSNLELTKVDNLFEKTAQAIAGELTKQSTIFYYPPDGVNVIQETNPEFFSVTMDVAAGDYVLIKTKVLVSGLVGAAYVVDANNRVLFTLENNLENINPYLLKVPANAKRVYVNGINSYNADFRVAKVSKALVDYLNLQDNIQQSRFYNIGSDLTVSTEINNGFFTYTLTATEGDYFKIHTKTYGVARQVIFLDKDNKAIRVITPGMFDKAYILKAPKGTIKLLVNCSYDFKNKLIVKKVTENLSGSIYLSFIKEDLTFYYPPDGLNIKQEENSELFAISIPVQAGQSYAIDAQSFSLALRYFIVDSEDLVISRAESNDTTPNGEEIVTIPEGGAFLYVNCAQTYKDYFSVFRVANETLQKTDVDLKIIQGTFKTVGSDNKIQDYPHPDFQTAEITNLVVGEKIRVQTRTYGVAVEYLFINNDSEVLEFKPTEGNQTNYVITVPERAYKLYVNCANEFASAFKLSYVSNSSEINTKKDLVLKNLPNYDYFGLLRKNCPNFYRKFKEKTEDVTVVLTGTSLTQGNLYTTERGDANTRPAGLHANDLASAIFDKLINHWDGQEYHRYDHDAIFYSNSNWSITTEADGEWDDHTYIKNGLTKTTVDSNANISTKIPANAWQFNFVYRTNSNGCDSRIEITQGANYVEVYDGANWVEAHNFQFSNYEPPATATKGNTQYQKRLKMRCKNKAGGVNSIGTEKQILIKKISATGRFNVIGFEFSPREYMLSVINGARGGHEWGDPTGNRLDKWQDTDIWAFNPDLLLAEVTIINWAASEPSSMSVDPIHYVNTAKRAYFNEFEDMPTSLYAMSEGYTKCEVLFYSDTLAVSSAVSAAWDTTTGKPKFGTVTTAAQNGVSVDTKNLGRVKNNFENYEAVEAYMSTKPYIFIPVLNTFKTITEKVYGSYYAGMQPSGVSGETLTIDGLHFNDLGATVFSNLIASIFNDL